MNVRTLAATNANVEEMIKARGGFARISSTGSTRSPAPAAAARPPRGRAAAGAALPRPVRPSASGKLPLRLLAEFRRTADDLRLARQRARTDERDASPDRLRRVRRAGHARSAVASPSGRGPFAAARRQDDVISVRADMPLDAAVSTLEREFIARAFKASGGRVTRGGELPGRLEEGAFLKRKRLGSTDRPARRLRLAGGERTARPRPGLRRAGGRHGEPGDFAAASRENRGGRAEPARAMPVIAYTFGPFRIDLKGAPPAAGRRRSSTSRSTCVDVLVYLVSTPASWCPREQLLDALWPGVFVTDNTVSRAISDLRRALGDDPRSPRYIQTAARRGYRFVAAGRAASHDEGRAAGRPGTRLAATPRPQSPPRRRRSASWRRCATSSARSPTSRPSTLDTACRPRASGCGRGDAAAALRARARRPRQRRRAGIRGHPRARPRSGRAERRRVAHARLACELDPALAEAWATLAFALTVEGVDPEEARTAARRAVMIDGRQLAPPLPARVRRPGATSASAPCRRTLALMPGMPFACFIGAMVHVAQRRAPGGARPARPGVGRRARPAHRRSRRACRRRASTGCAAPCSGRRGDAQRAGAAVDSAARESPRTTRRVSTRRSSRSTPGTGAPGGRTATGTSRPPSTRSRRRCGSTRSHGRSAVALAALRTAANAPTPRHVGTTRRPPRRRAPRAAAEAPKRLPAPPCARLLRGDLARRHRHSRRACWPVPRPATPGGPSPSIPGSTPLRGTPAYGHLLQPAGTAGGLLRRVAVRGSGSRTTDRGPLGSRPHDVAFSGVSLTDRSVRGAPRGVRWPVEVRHATLRLVTLARARGSLSVIRHRRAPTTGAASPRWPGPGPRSTSPNPDGLERKGHVRAAGEEGIHLVFAGRETLVPWDGGRDRRAPGRPGLGRGAQGRGGIAAALYGLDACSRPMTTERRPRRAFVGRGDRVGR